MKRLHVHVGVADLDRSIGFYSTLFGAEPAVVKPDYAKWMLDDPRVNFAISSGDHAAKGIEHLGIQAGDELDRRSRRNRVGSVPHARRSHRLWRQPLLHCLVRRRRRSRLLRARDAVMRHRILSLSLPSTGRSADARRERG